MSIAYIGYVSEGLHVFFLSEIEISKTGWCMLMEKACSGSKYACIMLIH